MRYNVELSCEYCGCPGFGWRSQVWFIGNAGSYRVWTQSHEHPKRILIRHAHEPLGWRRMVADIRELDNVGLGGDLLEYIEVRGIGEWEASLLRMAWCKFDGPADAQLAFLLALRDETIARLAEALGELTDERALRVLNDIIDAATSLHVPPSALEAIVVEHIPELGKDEEEDRSAAIEGWLSAHQPPGPSVVDVVEVRGAEQLARLVGGPSPTDPRAVALLLERWSVVNPKPFADGVFGSVHTRTTATFLEWAIQRVHSAGFEALAVSDPKAARRFAEAFIAHANREIHRYRTSGGGGGIGAAMRASLARSWIALKKDLLGQDLVESAQDGA